ncbi:hypothetical protein KX816_01265 [Sphingosinicellaceae bacterium]|nr:hypothetical protein KX816_01265 [Sphingosinicellaceae bacterium]
MIAEVGHALLWLAAACALLQTIAGLVPRARLERLTVPAAMANGWLWLWVVAGLGWVFWTTDLSVAGVAATTRSDLPGALRLVAIVVQPGGSVIVLGALLAWGGALLAFVAGQARPAIAGVGLASVSVAAILLVGVQPFARLIPAPTEGAGFPSATRGWLAALAPPGATVVDAPLPLGGIGNGVTLTAVTPVAGPDSTGVMGEVRVDGVVLLPEWRETMRPRDQFAAVDSRLGVGGWFAARLQPEGDGVWRVSVTRLSWLWLAGALAGVVALVAVIWARRR